METRLMINELRNVAHKNAGKVYGVGEVNIPAMCLDVADRLEELEKENTELKFHNEIELMIAHPERRDWEALYINGELVDEGHCISSERILNAIGCSYLKDYGYMEIPDEIAELGMPDRLWELETLVEEYND